MKKSTRWGWLVAGVILAAAEIVVPGVFLIWLAGAAMVTGLIVWAVPIGVPRPVGPSQMSSMPSSSPNRSRNSSSAAWPSAAR